MSIYSDEQVAERVADICSFAALQALNLAHSMVNRIPVIYLKDDKIMQSIMKAEQGLIALREEL